MWVFDGFLKLYSIEHFSLKHVQFNQWYNSKIIRWRFNVEFTRIMLDVTDIFAIIKHYYKSWMKDAISQSDLCWFFLLLLSSVDSCFFLYFLKNIKNYKTVFHQLFFFKFFYHIIVATDTAKTKASEQNSNNIIPLINLFFVSYS